MKQQLQITFAIAETIREVREIPNGELYASIMGHLTFEAYSGIIASLKRAGLVTETANVLRWIGPRS